MATIAEAPQMPVPVAISSVSGPETPRMRPISSVAANVRTRLPTITTIVRRPRSPTVPRLSRMPSSATPMRSTSREAVRMPGASDGRSSPGMFAIRAPIASAQMSALVPETRCGMRSLTTTIAVTSASPGARRRARSVRVSTRQVVAGRAAAQPGV